MIERLRLVGAVRISGRPFSPPRVINMIMTKPYARKSALLGLVESPLFIQRHRSMARNQYTHRPPMRSGFGKLIVLLLLGTGMGAGSMDGRSSSSDGPSVKGCASVPLHAGGTSSLPLAGAADFIVTVNGNLQWLVNGTVNPTLTLTRGQTYLFDLTAFMDEHPFVINAQAIFPFAPLLLQDSYGEIVPFTPSGSMPATIYYHCTVHYGSMTGTIHLVDPPCIGDLDGNHLVNSFDFGLFANAFGTSCSGCAADLDQNGTVNSFDFGIFANAFGNGCN